MTVLKNPYFLIPVLLFTINQYLEKVSGIFIPWVHAYLDDMLAMPVILGITLQVFRWIHPQKNQFVFKKIPLLVAWIYVSVVFEWYLPSTADYYIRDLWDVVCYALGTLFFHFKINLPMD